MAKILWITDYPVGATSGYATITKPICNQLTESGNEIIVLGLANKGEEHWENFSIIPIDNLMEAQAAIHNLSIAWKPDVFIMALDIPNLEMLYSKVAHLNLKCVAITPLENGPLTQSWAIALSQFYKVFFISQLGEDEARKVGLQNVGHLRVGIDSDLWSPAQEIEKKTARKNLGFEDTDKILITVADNQERKNLWAGLEIFRKVKEKYPENKYKYIIVTREHAPWGWKLQELASTMGIVQDVVIFERGMSQDQLRLLYACSDAFLLTSKAEGLGLPVLEAMAVGIPCVVTNTGALTELIKEGTGFLVPSAYTFIDVWGNSKRDMIDTEIGSQYIYSALNYGFNKASVEYVKTRSWEQPMEEISKLIKEITNG